MRSAVSAARCSETATGRNVKPSPRIRCRNGSWTSSECSGACGRSSTRAPVATARSAEGVVDRRPRRAASPTRRPRARPRRGRERNARGRRRRRARSSLRCRSAARTPSPRRDPSRHSPRAGRRGRPAAAHLPEWPFPRADRRPFAPARRDVPDRTFPRRLAPGAGRWGFISSCQHGRGSLRATPGAGGLLEGAGALGAAREAPAIRVQVPSRRIS